MRSYKSSFFKNKYLLKDLLGILLALTIGIGGPVIGSNRVRILIPKHPMLSVTDWPGSYAAPELAVSSTRDWQNKRQLFIRLNSREDANGNFAEMSQTATWFADTAETIKVWNSFHPKNIGQKLTSENLMSKDQPASRLYCRYDENYKTFCTFYAYRGHWVTWIDFISHTDEHFSADEIIQITTRASQLLMSASDEEISGVTPIQLTGRQLYPPKLLPCPYFQVGETRTVLPETLINGNLIIDGITQYDPNNTNDDGTISYFKKASTVTAPFGADCHIIYQGYIEELKTVLANGCGAAECRIIRFVLVDSDGQHIEVYNK